MITHIKETVAYINGLTRDEYIGLTGRVALMGFAGASVVLAILTFPG